MWVIFIFLLVVNIIKDYVSILDKILRNFFYRNRKTRNIQKCSVINTIKGNFNFKQNFT